MLSTGASYSSHWAMWAFCSLSRPMVIARLPACDAVWGGHMYMPCRLWCTARPGRFTAALVWRRRQAITSCRFIGPILLVGLGWPLVRRIVSLSKAQNITSIADFLSARYGKNQLLGGIAAFIAVIGVVPYISLQLKAVSFSLSALGPLGVDTGILETGFDVPMFVAVSMAIFAILFGTRHADATEHQNGLILSVAAESLVKLIAFIVVGAFITFAMMGRPAQLPTGPRRALRL